MQGDFVVKTQKLRDQANYYTTERQYADQLIQYLRRAQTLSPAKSAAYQELIKKADKLSTYYSNMSSSTKTICDEVEAASREIRKLFEDNTYDLSRRLG